MVLDSARQHRQAVRMSAPIPVLINRSGGTAAKLGDKLESEVQGAFAEAGVAIELHLLDGDKMEAAVKAASSHPLVVVGGGDGTLGGAAGVLAEAGAALGILPLGTRNHLARELGIPLGLADAAKLIAAGPRRRIDLARLNGRAFVNNASIGFYPELVRQRDAMALPKKLATLPATFATLRRMQDACLRLEMPDGAQDVTTPMLFIGNNRYALERGRLGQREALDAGTLSIYAVAPRPPAALIGFALRTIVGRADPMRDFAAIGDAASLEVTGDEAKIHVALDGEVGRFATPLRFTIEPCALTVIAPLEEAGGVP
jgi:diacylglycerol kinase family enzyme